MEEKLIWCLKIKSGIRITNPSEEEMESYIKRTEEDINNIEKVPENWKPIVSYYSVYYALYGILRGIGIKSENHLCSILVFEEILRMCKSSDNIVKEVLKLKNKREEAQKRANDFIKDSLNIYKVLVHGDYYERNILVYGDKCATIDFEEAHLGDPVEDIGKLSASYCLRIAYFKKVRRDAFNSVIKLLKIFFSTLKIPESKSELEKRLKVMVAGVILLSVDGLRNSWLPWVHDKNKKKLARELALNLILDDDNDIKTIITDFYKKL